jgi:hypothetical protein
MSDSFGRATTFVLPPASTDIHLARTDTQSQTTRGFHSFSEQQRYYTMHKTLSAYKAINDDDDSMTATRPTAANSSSFNNNDHEEIPDGCCPMCGIQLYKIREGGKWRKGKAIPVNLQGQVENGHCLSCEQELERESATTSAAGQQTICYCIGEYNIYGERHGPGELIWDNGDRYVGNFFNGLRDGNGTLFLSDGKFFL